jgi:hypothetical protein
MPFTTVPNSRTSCPLQQKHDSLLRRARPGCTPFRKSFAVKAEEGFQDKIKRLKESQKESGGAKKEGTPEKKAAKPKYNFSGEELHFESPPHRGDLAANIALGATLLWLPLTIAAVTRAAFVKYRFTDKRISVITNAPWKNEQLDAAYQEVADVKTVGRGVGLWGDMVVTLKNSDKIELRSLPQFLELKKYILERRDELVKTSPQPVASGGSEKSKSKGFGNK